jgi:catechol 2,3-dioxygenase-like lactoylglutathione lyase family enzyme
MNLKAFAHICALAQDLKKTEQFYCDGLGMEKVFEFEKNGKPSGFYLKIAGRNFIEFFLDDRPKGNDSPLRHLCFETEDIKALRQDLTAKGIPCGEISLGGDASWQFWIKDPNGIDIEFHEYTKDSSQFTGKPVLMTW